MRQIIPLVLAIFFILLTVYATFKTFFASFGPVLVDYVAFTAGFILIIDGFLGIKNHLKSKISNYFFPFARLVIGTCVFTIHLMQFLRDGKLGGQ